MTTIARVKFWVCINIYAILLDVLGCATLAIAILLLRTWLVATAFLCVISAFVFYGGIGVHSTYSEKCRIYNILVKRNSKGIKPESFKEFLSVPCHRMVVRMVLAQLHQAAMYKEIMKNYYVPPWKRTFSTKTTYRIFNTREEGEQWLLQRKNEIV